MILPFFINIYSIYKIISVIFGITLVDIYLILDNKKKIFLLIYIPIILLIFTYSIDYLKTYVLKLKPIFVVEVEEDTDAKLTVLDTGVNLQELVDGLNTLGVTPRDLISILQAIKASGALQAEIEVI